LLTVAPLLGCAGLFRPPLSVEYNRTTQVYEAGGPYEKVIRACAKGRKDIDAFERRCPQGSRCRQEENPGETNDIKSGYDYLEAASYYKLGQFQKAYDIAARPEYEYRKQMRNLLGDIHIATGKDEKAAREYFYLLFLGDPEGAARLLPPLAADIDRLTLNHQTPHLLNLRASLHERKNDIQSALRDYAASIGADPRQVHAYLEQARIYTHTGMPEKAMAELNTAAAIDRSNKDYSDKRMDELQMATIYFKRGRLRQQMGNLEGARDDLVISVQKSNDSLQIARANHEIGVTHEKLENLDRAIEAYKRATAIPGFADPWYRLTICYAQKGMPKEANDALVALASIDPQRADELSKTLKELALLD
ncbi:MAG: tetratricopeptide repeat protein, partial [Desulfatitalea sp.]